MTPETMAEELRGLTGAADVEVSEYPINECPEDVFVRDIRLRGSRHIVTFPSAGLYDRLEHFAAWVSAR